MDFRGISFNFKPTRASDAAKLDAAEKQLKKDWSDLNIEKQGAPAIILAMCDLYDGYFCDLLGEDYADKLGVDTEDVEDLMQLYADFAHAVDEYSKKLLETMRTALPKAEAHTPVNREQRRAERRAHRKH